MKRTVFIIIGSITLFLIFSLWLYLLLFGTPAEVRDAFTNFGFGSREATPISGLELPEQTGQVNLTSSTLSQLTMRPVAGFGLAQVGSSTAFALYAERGTGHVYRIDLGNGTETRLLQKTFVAVSQAFFASDGSAAVLVGVGNDGRTAHLEELEANRPTHQFPDGADNIAFVGDREVRYTITSQDGTIGYSYKLDTAETDQLFQTALSDVDVIWKNDETLLHSRPAPTLRGSLYRVQGNTMTRVGDSGLSFSSLASPMLTDIHIETYFNSEIGRLTSLVKESGAEDVRLVIATLADKCAFDVLNGKSVWCGLPLEALGLNDQSAWYKGMLNFSDFLWRIDLNTGEAMVDENLYNATGREVDVLDLTIDNAGSYLLFKNKLDDTLWLKRLTD